MVKKAFVILFAVLLLSPYGKAADICDLDQASGYARGNIEALVERSILTGDENGNINPLKTITRVEAIAMIIRTLGTFGINAGSLPSTATFQDVPVGSWAFPYVEAAYQLGLVKGVSSDEFKPDAPCTREQLAVLFVRAFDTSGQIVDLQVTITDVNSLSDGSEISAWAKDSVFLALKSGLVKGTGNNTFSPQLPAPKEQAAVIIDRFLAIRTQGPDRVSVPVSTDTGGPAVVFNGDVMALSHAPLVADGEVLLPADFFYRYFGPAESGAEVMDSDTTCIELTWGYHHLTSGYGNFYNTLWFKVGEETAYKSGFLLQSPFENPDTYSANALTLRTAPVLDNGVLYLPLEDICTITGAQYDFDASANTVSVTTDELPEYPQLRAALYEDYNVLSTGFRREVAASGIFTQTIIGGTPQPDAQINLGYSLNTRSNWQASQTDLEYILQQGDGEAQDLKYQKIVVPILSLKDVTDSKPGNWLNINDNDLQKLVTVSKLTGLDPIGTEKNVGVVTVSEKLVGNYENLHIERAGTVDLNGQKAVKYVIHLNGDDIMQVYGSGSTLFTDIFDQGYRYEIDLYVAGNALIRQEYHFSGSDSQENPSGQINVTMELSIEYRNLGKQLPITLDNGITVSPIA